VALKEADMRVIALKPFSREALAGGGCIQHYAYTTGQIIDDLPDDLALTYMGCGLVAPAALDVAQIPAGVTLLVDTPGGVGEAVVPTGDPSPDDIDHDADAPAEPTEAEMPEPEAETEITDPEPAPVSARKVGRPRKDAS
jgi:hypothetical protein